jgi:hypothetical protein
LKNLEAATISEPVWTFGSLSNPAKAKLRLQRPAVDYAVAVVGPVAVVFAFAVAIPKKLPNRKPSS